MRERPFEMTQATGAVPGRDITADTSEGRSAPSQEALRDTGPERTETAGTERTEGGEDARERAEMRDKTETERQATDESAIDDLRNEIRKMEMPTQTHRETPATFSPGAQERAAAIERALGIPIDRDRAAQVLDRTRTLDPIRYAKEAYAYARQSQPDTVWGRIKAAGKAAKMVLTTAGLRDSRRDAVFINFANGGYRPEVRLHETLHAVSEGRGLPRGRDFLGGYRAVSGVERVSADGTIQLTPLNEGLTNFFMVRAAREMKGGGEPKYSGDVKIVSRIAALLESTGQDGTKLLAKAYMEHDPDAIRDAVDRLGGDGSFDRLMQSMSQEGLLAKMFGIGAAARTMNMIEGRATDLPAHLENAA